jgi:3-hydroxy-9,10-secoandrosta-1,3,5(10)-triene-9,17-dione monooxygenase reductase component
VSELEIGIDPSVFRNVLGHLPTGVTVIASLDGDRPIGLAAGSFFSVSLEPPLVGFCVALTSSTWPVIERTGQFAVSVLADDQIEICRRLATKEPDKFATVAWSQSPVTGCPLVGAVRHLTLHREAAGSLVFCRGGYHRHAELS